jgi:hypothetical protein
LLPQTDSRFFGHYEFEYLGFLDEEVAFNPELYTRLSISRYAAGVVCTMMFEGATSTVRELTPEERGGVKMSVNGSSLPIAESSKIVEE